MTFKEKIDKILRNNELEINSPTGLEAYINASTGAITKFYRKNEEPGGGTIKKILSLPGLNKEWWDTGKGDVFLKNPTPVQERSDNSGKLDFNAEEVYRKIVEGGTEYLLVPKTAFEGKYRFVPIEQIESHARSLERRDHQIEGLYEIIKLIASGRSIDFSKIEDAQKDAPVGDAGA